MYKLAIIIFSIITFLNADFSIGFKETKNLTTFEFSAPFIYGINLQHDYFLDEGLSISVGIGSEMPMHFVDLESNLYYQYIHFGATYQYVEFFYKLTFNSDFRSSYLNNPKIFGYYGMKLFVPIFINQYYITPFVAIFDSPVFDYFGSDSNTYQTSKYFINAGLKLGYSW
ncbi:MAG: hypothetical protein KU37_07230 [Sulfuricurvum sp. PC08-66]|nr:MAG: hypothetical protein KU37_07230 [Sulfuricurvum sp. PC08-66]